MKKLALVGCVAALLLAAAGEAVAARNAWINLGSRTVTDRVDHDVIVVRGERRELRALKISVRKKAVEFHRVVVHYANGASQKLDIRRVIPAGGETRVLDLVGGERVVTRVEFWYDAQSLGGRAVVRLHGRR